MWSAAPCTSIVNGSTINHELMKAPLSTNGLENSTNTPVDVLFLCKPGWEPYYENILPYLNISYAYAYDWTPKSIFAYSPVVLVSIFGIPPEIAVLVMECKRRGIATLRLQDGVVEWRHCWENPKQNEQSVPRFRPSLFDKIAVFGPLYRRILENWGNIGKCEIAGCPRWDNLDIPTQKHLKNDPVRILVASARNPGFTTPQIDAAEEAFSDLRDHFSMRNDIEPVWRISSVIQKRLGLENNNPEMDRMTVTESLSSVDAVICTPSTLQLEAMIAERPVASLDYNIIPQYLNLAWSIHCKTDIAQVIDELIAPSPEKMFFQNWACQDAVLQDGQAGKRVAFLIHALREWSKGGCDSKHLSNAILADTQWPISLPKKGVSLKDLLPDHPMVTEIPLYEKAANCIAQKLLATQHTQICWLGENSRLKSFFSILRKWKIKR